MSFSLVPRVAEGRHYSSNTNLRLIGSSALRCYLVLFSQSRYPYFLSPNSRVFSLGVSFCLYFHTLQNSIIPRSLVKKSGSDDLHDLEVREGGGILGWVGTTFYASTFRIVFNV